MPHKIVWYIPVYIPATFIVTVGLEFSIQIIYLCAAVDFPHE